MFFAFVAYEWHDQLNTRIQMCSHTRREDFERNSACLRYEPKITFDKAQCIRAKFRSSTRIRVDSGEEFVISAFHVGHHFSIDQGRLSAGIVL